MEYLTDGELDAIIKKHWPKTSPTVGLYNMLRDAADLRVKKLLNEEAKQESVASYRLSVPIAEPDTATQAAKPLTDEAIFKLRDAIKPGDGWDGDCWDLALAYAVQSHLKGE